MLIYNQGKGNRKSTKDGKEKTMKKIYIVTRQYGKVVGAYTNKEKAEKVRAEEKYGNECCGSNEGVYLEEVELNEEEDE